MKEENERRVSGSGLQVANPKLQAGGFVVISYFYVVPIGIACLKLYTMKKIIIAALTCALSMPLVAQKVSAEDVPSIVLNAFKTRFPAVSGAKWEKEGTTGFEASFKMNKESYSAGFDLEGKWLETEKPMSMKSLPESVLTTLQNEFKGFQVKEVESVETADRGNFFEMEISKGKEIYELQVSAEGKVLKKEVKSEK